MSSFLFYIIISQKAIAFGEEKEFKLLIESGRRIFANH
jgi:hypothetical protein